MNSNTNSASELLSEMHRNTEMSCDAVNSVLDKVEGKAMLSALTDIIVKSSDYTMRACELSHQRGITPKKISKMKKLSAQAGIAMNTAFDSSDSHIAEMVEQGLTMGASRLRELCAELNPDDPPVTKLCGEIAAYEEEAAKTIARFK